MKCATCKQDSSHWWKKENTIICDACYNKLHIDEQVKHIFFIPEG